MQKNCFQNQKIYSFCRFSGKAYSAFSSMHKIVNIGVLSGCTLLAAHSQDSSAQSFPSSDQQLTPEMTLDEVTITASEPDLILNVETAKLITVITKEDIARQPAISIEDLLKSVSGIDIKQRGANGVQADVSVRGGTPDQIAILLNGINLSNPQTGHYNFDIPINLSDIERIEIIQGPSSLLYGASAFSGGINIITKQYPDSNYYVNLQSGMHQLFGVEARSGILTKRSSHQLSAGYNRSDGYIEDSDYRIFNVLWQSQFDSKSSKINFQTGYNNKAYGANTFYSAIYPHQFDHTQTFFASVQGESKGRVKLIPKMYWNRHWDCFQLFRDGFSPVPSWYTGHNYHQSDVFGFNFNAQYVSKTGISNFGGEFRNESILSNVLGKALDSPEGKYSRYDSRSNISYFFEQQFNFRKFSFALGVLFNHNTSLHNNFDFFPNINASWQASPGLKIYASWNNAMRMPTFTDLYYTTKTHTGNTNLLPEKSSAWEAGVKYKHKRFTSHFTGFYNMGKEIIDWVKQNPEDLWQSGNQTRLDCIGLETGAGFDLNSFLPGVNPFSRIRAGYCYIDQTKSSDKLISKYALDYLRHKFTMELNHRIFQSVSADWLFRWQDRAGEYTSGTGEQVPYPAYAVLDLKINWQLKNFKIYFLANNIFNVTYYDLGDIPQPGCWVMGGISLSHR